MQSVQVLPYPRCGRKEGGNCPVLLRLEDLDLMLPLTDLVKPSFRSPCSYSPDNPLLHCVQLVHCHSPFAAPRTARGQQMRPE